LRASPAREQPIACASWTALGTGVAVRVRNPDSLAAARAAVELELAAIDRACSRFREDSELARVNARPGRPVRVDSLFIDALEVALDAARLTDGDVDPTLGRELELAGYDRDWEALRGATGTPAHAGAITARVRRAWPEVLIDREACTVRTPTGVRLDLGATAKAWAADRAARAAAGAGACGVLVSVGGDIATCGACPAGGWLVRVTDDHRSEPTADGQTIAIRDGGLATSSTAVRRWQHAGRVMHHIIDPRTGAPAQPLWRTVSVAAADCTQANIAATAAIVRGAGAPAWLSALALPARLLDWEGNVSALAGWPKDPHETSAYREDAVACGGGSRLTPLRAIAR
jgi:thiamine biosynthesis lipoprotein